MSKARLIELECFDIDWDYGWAGYDQTHCAIRCINVNVISEVFDEAKRRAELLIHRQHYEEVKG